MDEFNKNEINEEELDEVSGGRMFGNGKLKWMYTFDYQQPSGRLATVMSKDKYKTKAQAQIAGTAHRNKFADKKPTKLYVFDSTVDKRFLKK